MSSDPNASYVAEGLIPPSKPPASEVGVIRWLRRNLFNGVVDSVLTLISVTAIVLLVLPLVDWAILNGVWNASLLDECREIIAASHDNGAHGACWAVFNGRIGVLMFGFYPPELYWRPILACVLLFVALAPVLFGSLPRQMLWFSLTYPVIAYFLIWGGLGLEAVESARLGGLFLTVIVAVTGFATALPVGILLALGRQSSMFFFRAISAMFIEFIRGVPLIVLPLIMFVLLYTLLTGIWIDPILWAAFVVALPTGVYIAEALRRGLESLPQGQDEAAAVLGLKYWNTTRLIVLPQALSVSSPQIAYTAVGLVRDTTIVMFAWHIDLVGLVPVIRAEANWNGILWELVVVIPLLYWVVCFAISRYAKYLDHRLEAVRRGGAGRRATGPRPSGHRRD